MGASTAMSARPEPMIRLEPMSESDFRESLRRSIPLHAADYVRRGLWTEEASLAAMEKEFAQLLPDGRHTRDRHFAKVIDSESGHPVGETWYLVQERGGKVRFWVDWIFIEPGYRRQGYATAAFRRLEDEARRQGADRIGLTVWSDNPGAVALYAKLGYTPATMWMMKLLEARG